MRDKQQRKNPTNADRIRKETTELKRYKKYIIPYLSAFVIGPLMMLTEVAGVYCTLLINPMESLPHAVQRPYRMSLQMEYFLVHEYHTEYHQFRVE